MNGHTTRCVLVQLVLPQVTGFSQTRVSLIVREYGCVLKLLNKKNNENVFVLLDLFYMRVSSLAKTLSELILCGGLDAPAAVDFLCGITDVTQLINMSVGLKVTLM